MKKCSLLLVVLFLLGGILSLSAYAAESPAVRENVLFYADFDTPATLEEIGISTSDWGGAALPTQFSMTVADGKLKIKRDGTSSFKAVTCAFEFLSKEELAQVGKLKVEYDVSSAMGGFNAGGNDYSIGLEACKSAAAANSYYAFQMCGKTFEMVYSSAKVNNSWERSKADYRYEITLLNGVSDGLNKEHHVELIFDFDKRTVDYSIDGVAALDPAPLPADDSGLALEVYGKAYDLTVDNLKATQLFDDADDDGNQSEDHTAGSDTGDTQKPVDPTPSEPTKESTDTASPSPTQPPEDTTGTPGDASKPDGGCKSSVGWGTVAIAVLVGSSVLVSFRKKK